jgi:hypothetical protein
MIWTIKFFCKIDRIFYYELLTVIFFDQKIQLFPNQLSFLLLFFPNELSQALLNKALSLKIVNNIIKSFYSCFNWKETKIIKEMCHFKQQESNEYKNWPNKHHFVEELNQLYESHIVVISDDLLNKTTIIFISSLNMMPENWYKFGFVKISCKFDCYKCKYVIQKLYVNNIRVIRILVWFKMIRKWYYRFIRILNRKIKFEKQ